MQAQPQTPSVAIACGGTGGHLFPGIAVGEALCQRGCEVTLFISPKEVDQTAAQTASGMDIVTLPAIALRPGAVWACARRFWQSYRQAKCRYQARRPAAILAMGGFTSAPPVLAGRACGAATFIHEANAIPGRANRWLAPWIDQAFVFFPGCARRLRSPSVRVVGMPVRNQFQRLDASACRVMLGLDGQAPVLLVMGGSQGASAINELVLRALPALRERNPQLQFLHLTGPRDEARVRAAYASAGGRAVVRPFLTEMELALNAATVAVSRAGASSLAEIAAVGLPTLFIPYPLAADNHQFYNALALVESGAARMMTQKIATPDNLADLVLELMNNPAARQALATALHQWHRPEAADRLADELMKAVAQTDREQPELPPHHCAPGFSQKPSI